jgi:hypothetical protein
MKWSFVFSYFSTFIFLRQLFHFISDTRGKGIVDRKHFLIGKYVGKAGILVNILIGVNGRIPKSEPEDKASYSVVMDKILFQLKVCWVAYHYD